jgi:hypothetical protein
MNDYIIGAGAILTAGAEGGIAPAALHVQTDPLLADTVSAAAFDFEGDRPNELQRLVVVASGWNARRFDERVTAALRLRGSACLGEVLVELARAVETERVHLFAAWLPDDRTLEIAGRAGITVVVHALETVGRASLVSSGRRLAWAA